MLSSLISFLLLQMQTLANPHLAGKLGEQDDGKAFKRELLKQPFKVN